MTGLFISKFVNLKVLAVGALIALVASLFLFFQRSIVSSERLEQARRDVAEIKRAGAVGTEHQKRIIKEQEEAANGSREHFENEW